MANASTTSSVALLDCTQSESATVERVNYFPRQLLTADDMFADQDYFRLKLQRHNRFMHGWGTVCGLLVTAAPTTSSPWLVQISGGYSLGPYGDEIFVGESVTLDLSTCGPSSITNPCEPDSLLGTGSATSIGATVYIAIQYSECMSRPVSVTPSGCGCDQTSCENSRIRDSFQIQCLASLPPSYQLPPPAATMCDFLNGQEVPDCPPCPSDPWVVLAAVTLPASPNSQVAGVNIDNHTYRRQIFSTAVLQEQIAECCCGPVPTPTPAPTPPPPPPPSTVVKTINFRPNERFQNSGPSTINVTFSQPVLRSSLTPSTFIVRAKNSGVVSNVNGAIGYDASAFNTTSSATFTPKGGFPSGPNQENPDVDYTVTLLGTAPTPILDINNLALDGDANGQPGGNFTSGFTVFAYLV